MVSSVAIHMNCREVLDYSSPTCRFCAKFACARSCLILYRATDVPSVSNPSHQKLQYSLNCQRSGCELSWHITATHSIPKYTCMWAPIILRRSVDSGDGRPFKLAQAIAGNPHASTLRLSETLRSKDTGTVLPTC